MTLPNRDTMTKLMQKRISVAFIEPNDVFNPIPAKKIGAKNMYELMSTRRSM